MPFFQGQFMKIGLYHIFILNWGVHMDSIHSGYNTLIISTLVFIQSNRTIQCRVQAQ